MLMIECDVNIATLVVDSGDHCGDKDGQSRVVPANKRRTKVLGNVGQVTLVLQPRPLHEHVSLSSRV